MEKITLKKVLLSLFGWSFIAAICATVAVLSGTFLYLNPSLPDVDTLRDVELQTPLRVFSADNKLIGEFGEKRRDPIDFDDAPQYLVDAILSAEDDGFYHHKGVDIKGLIRAATELAITGSIQSGGSTITMQVARNFFLTRSQTFSRKFNEILLAIKIEQELTKEEILELYLNKIYLGNRAYGVKAASQVYYGKPIKELSLAQLAMIAGLPKAPSTFNPIVNSRRAIIRRDWILGRMLSLGKISQDEYQQAIDSPVTATYHTQKLDLHAPYVAEIARDKAISLLGDKAYTGGYAVKTTVDSRLQAAGQKAVIDGLLAYTQRHGYRGPELQLDPKLLPPLSNITPDTEDNTPITVSDSQLGEVNLLPWIEQLKKVPSYGGLQPAAVISIQEKSFTAILDTGEAVNVNWKNGLNKAGRYVNENFFSPVPKTAGKIVKLGDVVRVVAKPDKEGISQWHFTQVPKVQGALIALDPKNGAIRTVIGGFDFKQSSFNRATQAKRLPGSNFKPFVYGIGLESGLTAASIFNDAPIVIEDSQLENTWRPENASGKFFGPTGLRKALYLSRNLVSIRLLRSIGIDRVLDTIDRFGVDGKALPRDLSIALGTHVMTPLEIATGYSTFANNGYQVESFMVDEIKSNQGEIVYKATPLTVMEENTNSQTANAPGIQDNLPKPTLETLSGLITTSPAKDTDNQPRPAPRVMDERVTYIMNSILRDVVIRGTAKRAQRLNRRDIGGKTGTTNGPTDAWFSGFNHHLVATAWVGFDDNSKIGKREYGGTAALPIWIDFMQEALKDIPETIPEQPDGIVIARINPETGKLTTPENPKGVDELFLEETAPTELADATENNTEQDRVSPEDIF